MNKKKKGKLNRSIEKDWTQSVRVSVCQVVWINRGDARVRTSLTRACVQG